LQWIFPFIAYDICGWNPCPFYEKCVNDGRNFTCVPQTNVALYKHARQSSKQGSGTADRAVDGNSNSHYGDKSCTHTKSESKAWWEVDFGRIYNITGVEITNRGDCCAERLSNFSVLIDGEL